MVPVSFDKAIQDGKGIFREEMNSAKDRLVAVFFAYDYLSLVGFKMKHDEMQVRIINLEEIKMAYKGNKLNEAYSDAVGFWISTLMKMTYGRDGVELPFRLAGQKGDLSALLHSIGMEKRYIDTALSLGLDSPQTMKVRSALDAAVNSFEAKTGISWPFKN
jgi:hypothetical protein